MAERVFNSYPLKTTIEEKDLGILWNTASSDVENFTMEKLAQFMIKKMEANISVDENGILTL